MRRRELLRAGAVGLCAGVAGCSGLEAPSILPGVSDDRRHPLAGRTTVRVDDHSDTDHDVETNAREALAYWEDNAPAYAGVEVDFSVVDEARPDVAIEYVDSPERCRDVEGYSERVLGCAPRVTADHRLRETVTAVVVAGDRPFGKIRITTKHELGHVLGLGHGDPPAEIMSDRPEDRIPLYDVRIDIWETVLAAKERAQGATERFRAAMAAWNDGAYATVESTAGTAREDFAAAWRDFERAHGRTDEFEGHPRVETVDLSGVRAQLDALAAKMGIAEAFCGHLADAGGAMAAGDRRGANEAIVRTNDRIAAYNAAESPATGEVAVALGLVRGIDREDDVVGEADGEV